MASPLTGALQRQLRNISTIHGGPATITNTSPLEVTINGGVTLPASRSATYNTGSAPANGDQVYVLYTDGDSVFIIDKIHT